jgi:hypothetical protein
MRKRDDFREISFRENFCFRENFRVNEKSIKFESDTACMVHVV